MILKSKTPVIILTIIFSLAIFIPIAYAGPPKADISIPDSCTLAMTTVTNSWHWLHYGLECAYDLLTTGQIIYY